MLGIRQIVPTKFGKYKETICRKKNRQIVLHVRQIGFRQMVFRRIVPNPRQILLHQDLSEAILF